jgi:hypothetical protein
VFLCDAVLISRLEGTRYVRHVSCAGDGSFVASCGPENRILFTPRDEEQPQRWIEAHADIVSALTSSGVYEVRLKKANH